MAETIWTDSDLEDLNCAIKAKASGKRLIAEDLGGKMQQWADAPLDQLISLRDRMISELGASASSTSRRPNILRTRYDKGL